MKDEASSKSLVHLREQIDNRLCKVADAGNQRSQLYSVVLVGEFMGFENVFDVGDFGFSGVKMGTSFSCAYDGKKQTMKTPMIRIV